MKRFLGVILTAVIFLTAFQQSGQIISVSADEFEQYIRQYGTDQLIDVRTPAEYREGHIRGAKLVNLYEPDFKQKLLALRLKKDKPVLVYCRSGNRSLVAARFLASQGYKVINLKYGIKDWRAKGKPVEK
ncbi:MAG: rhodanese-like domain-containing protein [Chlorobi bacterium]|nr:rhodanese-like domain-containing protein [Chlorobiota bacterium]